MLKKHLSKLVSETKLPWTKCLPVALVRTRTTHRKGLGVSPHEVLFGWPYLGGRGEMPALETEGKFLQNCVLGLSAALLFLKGCGPLAQTPPLEFPVHSSRVGDWS